MENAKGSEYKHMLIVVFFAFKTLISISTKRACYLQMKPGSGKTFVALLIVSYYKRHEPSLIPVYVCLNSVLKQQVEEKARSVGLGKMLVILQKQINSYLQQSEKGKKYYYIVDEFHQMLKETVCTPDNSDLLPGIFRVGLDEDLILMTGHYS